MTQDMATRFCAAIVAVYALLLCSTAAVTHGWPGSGRTVAISTDYVSLWTAGRMALEGRAVEAYDGKQHKEAAKTMLGLDLPAAKYLPFPYPPPFLALMALLGLLAYGVSNLVWVTLGFAAYAAAAARIIGSPRGAVWMTASIATFYNAYAGQTGALSAALMGFGLVLVPTRPILAGICLGALSYKPHLGILIPNALAAAGYWRVFASAAVTVVAMVVASSLMFGFDAWPAFISQLDKMATHISAAGDPGKLQSLYGLLRTIGVPPALSFMAQALLGAGTAIGIALLWRRNDVAYELKAATLAACALLMSPYLFIYDSCVLMVAQAFLLRLALATQFDETECLGLLLSIVMVGLFLVLKLPTAFFGPLIMLALIARRLHGLPAANPVSLPGFDGAKPA